MEPKKRMKASLPPHFYTMHTVGLFALAVGLLSLFSTLRPAIIRIAPWLGIAPIAWAIVGLGLFVLFVNGARLIAYARRVKANA